MPKIYDNKNMKKAIEVLKDLGIKDQEIDIYLAALEGSPCSVIELAKRTGMKRSSVYNFINDMIRRGLLAAAPVGKKFLYAATDPSDLTQILDKQKEKLLEAIPELSLIFTKSGSEKPKVRFYDGTEGLKTVYNDTLNQPDGSEILFIATWSGTFDVLPKSFVDSYVERRIKKSIKTRSIVPYDEFAAKGKKNDKKELRDTLIVPAEDLPIKSKINIYGDKVAIMNFGGEKISVIIESEQTAATLRAIFNLLWKSLRKK